MNEEAPKRSFPTKADAMATIQADADKRKRAARQASAIAHDVAPVEMVKSRVTHKGDGKISMGEHVGGLGEVHHEKGETFVAAREIAEELQERGLSEIV